MHLVSVSDVSRSHDGRRLFAGVSFGVTSGDRIGVVGPNGSGKSTLLRIVAQGEPPDSGEVVHNSAARTSYLSQQPDTDTARTALQVAAVAHDVRRHEAEAMLDVLGIDPEVPLDALSGGQRRRVALAATLTASSDLLILDEPTNHLDADAIDWLEQELSRRRSGLLMVTHDRYLLERVCNRMLEMEPSGDDDVPGTAYWHEGSYSSLLEARAERQEIRDKIEARRRNRLRSEIAWLRRGPKARTSKPKFRVEQAALLQQSGPADQAPPLELGTGRRRLGSKVLDIEGVTFSYGEHTVLREAELHAGRGDRIGVVGPNGSGKTTLLNLLIGALQADEGVVEWGPTVELGVLEQEARAAASNVRVIDTVLEIGTHLPLANGEKLPATRLAERFGFHAGLQQALVSNLSGGERRRLALLHLLIRGPNVLVLDEPTNDLDLDTLGALEDHLDAFGGTLIVASHDRFLLDRLSDRIVAVAPDGRLREHLDWESYRDARRRSGPSGSRSGAADPSATDNRKRQERRRELRALEQRIAKLGAQRDTLEHALAEAATDYEQAAKLDAELRQLHTELEVAEDEWLTLSVD